MMVRDPAGGARARGRTRMAPPLLPRPGGAPARARAKSPVFVVTNVQTGDVERVLAASYEISAALYTFRSSSGAVVASFPREGFTVEQLDA